MILITMFAFIKRSLYLIVSINLLTSALQGASGFLNQCADQAEFLIEATKECLLDIESCMNEGIRIQQNKCKMSPCRNGTCVNLDHDCECECEPGFSGMNCSIKLDAIIHVVLNDSTLTYKSSEKYCQDNKAHLCYWKDICQNNTPIITGVLTGDHWAPIRDNYDNWVEIGDHLNRVCFNHQDYYGAPTWGTKQGECPPNNRRNQCDLKGNVFCCRVVNDDCNPNPCLNGECFDLVQGYKCSCNRTYVGQNCSHKISSNFTYVANLDGKHYYQTTVSSSWSDSRKQCQSLGGDLATIGVRNIKYRNFFVKRIQQKECWIGLIHNNQNNQWYWIDNYSEKLFKKNIENPQDYKFNCGFLRQLSNKQFNCSSSHKALCEIEN